MNAELKKILLKMNENAQDEGRPIPFPPTEEGYKKLLRIIRDTKIKLHKKLTTE